MALTLSNILTRVKRYVPTTTHDTEIQDAILERMNYLVSLETFPFQETYEEYTASVNDYRIATPSNFAAPKDLVIWTADSEIPLNKLDAVAFDKSYPNPSNQPVGEPVEYCIKVEEAEIWFNCPCDIAYVFRLYFYKIPDDATDTTVSQMVELAKIILERWGASDGFRMMGEYDRADKMESEGNKMLAALKRRYQLSMEEDARVISFKEMHLRRRAI
jgi:hypothetical protein